MPPDTRQSQTYIWSTKDVLGRGATSIVYRGINRITGVPVAVKTFNLCFSSREFEVLEKIKHENIVKLLGIETEELRNRLGRQILVTELCTGGSLNDILEDPENMYGLDDTEFLRVLSHLYAGMKYLRDNDIIHRDLKPGNIMKFIKDDGTSVYKLIDFGAARELSDETGFKSLYGTEEYLCPDMYPMAVLGVHAEESFRATVDLWSIGVTLYHVATGELPFRPFGGRRNKKVMYQITSQKESGVISGVQHTEKGEVYWRKELPNNCLLGAGLRKIVTPLIAGLLESDKSKIWSFERFFSDVGSILSAKEVNIFFVNKTSLLKVYLKNGSGWGQLQKDIIAQTGLNANNQILIFKNTLVSDDIIPLTTEDNPLFLFSKENNKITLPFLKLFSQTIAFTRPIDTFEDAKQAKIACRDAYRVQRLIEQYALYSKLVGDAVENMTNFINVSFDKMNQNAQHLLDKNQMLKRMAEILEVSQRISDYRGSGELKLNNEKLNKDILMPVYDLYKKHVIEKCLKIQWDASTERVKNPANTRCTSRAKIQVGKLRNSMLSLKQRCGYPINNEYMLEKRKIRDAFHYLINILENEVFPQYKTLIEKFEEWCSTARISFLKIDILLENIKECQVYLAQFEEKLETNNNQYNEYLKLKKRPDKINKIDESPSKMLNKELKNTLKTYKSKNLHSMIEENKKLQEKLQECTLGLRETILT